MSKTFLLTLCIFLIFQARAQAPKIGLALSGGGAKGMAHIGAIRALEEAGITPDYISGTSMGAVVGAMYAMGYTVDEIEEYLLSVNWEALLQNDIPRQRLSYLDRRDEERYLLTLALTPNGITLPRAINMGHYMNKQLAHLTQKAHGKTNFSQFPIPFLCVATDLETGEEIIIEQGDLADALRASVSFPSIFAPFEFQGRLCVDGGVRNNLPISILKEKGMDYIIAIDLQSKLYSRDRLNSLVKVLEQVGSFQNALYFSEQSKDADILVQPPTDEFGFTSYDFSKKLISLGYEYTVAALDSQDVFITDSIMPRSIYPVLGTPRNEVRITAIQIEGNNRYSRNYILGRLRVKPDEYYSTDHIEKGLDRLFGTHAFNIVKYRLLPVNGGFRLKVEVEEKDEYGQLQFGLHYDDDFKMAVLANATFSNLLLPSDRLALDVAVGDFPRADLSYIFEHGYWPALGLEFSARRNPAIIYENQRAISEIRIEDLSANAFLHSTIRNIYTIGAGIKLQDFSLSERLPIPDFQPRNVSYINYHGFLDFDSFNRTFKPSRGFSLFAEGRIIAQHENLQTFREPSLVFQLHYKKVFKISRAWSLLTGFSGASTIGPELDYPYQIFFGGLGTRYPNFSFPFAGYRYGEIFGRNGAFVRADLNYEFASNNFVTAFYNVGGMESTIDGLFNTERFLDGYGISYGYNSPLGPVELSLMSSTNHSRFYTYINLGYWF